MKCGQVLGHHPGDFSSETRIDKSCDQTHLPHALRIRATEGISDVDLEVCSHPLWKRFVKKLTPTDKNILAIWVCHCSCFFCDEPHASAQHLFVNCSKFEKLNFKFSLMSHPLGGKNSFVVPAKAVGLPLALVQTLNPGSHMQ